MSLRNKKTLVIILGLLWGVAFLVGLLTGPFSVVKNALHLAVLCLLQLILPAVLLYPAMRWTALGNLSKGWRITLGLICGTVALSLAEGIVLAVREWVKVITHGNWNELWLNIANGMGFGAALGAIIGLVVCLAVSLVLVLTKEKINKDRPAQE